MDNRLIIEPSDGDYPQLKNLYGYIANLKERNSDDEASPFSATVVAKLPFRYGANDSEYQFSWAFARINAFAAKAVFEKKGSWGFLSASSL